MSAEADQPEAEPKPLRRRGLHPAHLSGILLTCLIVLVLGLAALIRFGVLTQTGRDLIVREVDGLPLGSVGRLHVSGLKGDFWHDFTVDRLSIVDAGGPWLDVRHLHLRWDPARLLRRRVYIRLAQADQLTLLHRPTISGGGSGGGMPVSIFIEQLGVRLETLPAFSIERGLFRVGLRLDIERSGGVAGAIQSRNLFHAGDGLEAIFDLGVSRRVMLDGRAHESRGGALAGVLGLPVAKAVMINAKAGGDLDQGQSQLSAYSGDTQIAQAAGVWTKAGGGLRGHISLAASTWTAPFLHSFGPNLDFSVKHSQVHGPLRDVVVQLATDNAAATVVGPLDIDRRRSDQGLKLSLTSKDLSKLIAKPALGPGRLDAIWKGGLGDWDLLGRASVERLVLGDYTLGAAAGPVHASYHKRELRLITTADGSGGQGGGFIGAWAGGRPQASLDASRLADGRLLLHTLKIDGAGLKLDASGAVGLLGDLNFKGGAQLTNLAAARPGAKGAVAMHWSASQFRAKQPWKLTADATGSGFALGIGELDRLLGGKPELHLAASYDDGAIGIAKADLSGAAARVTTKGTITRDGVLKLALDGAGQGPISLGPVQIPGKLRASGALSGPWSTVHLDLVADSDHLDLPQLNLSDTHGVFSLTRGPDGLSGKITLASADTAGPAHGVADYHWADGGLALSGLDIAAGGATARGAIGLHDWALASADLTVGAGPGVFLDQGRLDAHLKIDDPDAQLSLTGADLKLKGQTALISAVKLNANGPLAHLPYTVTAAVQTDQAPLNLNGQGTASRTDKGLGLTFGGSGRFRRADFRTLEPALITLYGPERTAQLDLSVGGGRAQILARQDEAALNATAALTGVDLGALGENLAGRVDAKLALNGEGPQLTGTLDAHLKGARSRDAPSKLALNGSVMAKLDGARLSLNAAVDGSSTTDHATVDLALPAESAAAPFRIAIDRTKPINGQFTVSGELQPIWDLFFGGQRELGGQLSAQGDLHGTLAAPRLSGHGALAQGRFEDAATGLKLKELAADVDFQDEAVNVQRFNAKDAKSGSLSGSGQLSLAPGGASTLKLNANNFQLLDNETAKATASGAVTVVRDANGKTKLSGDLTINHADIQAASSRSPPGVVAMDVVERNKPFNASDSLQAPPPSGPALQLDVRLKAAQRIFVRGLGLDAELSLDAQVIGDTSAPILQGQARIVRGAYDFAGKRFEISDDGVVDLATSPDKIRLDLTAELNDPTLTAIIRIKGTAAKPLITLTSTPVLPSDEVLSQVLFGQSAAQLSPVQAAQLAAAVTTLATGGGFDVIGGLGRFAKLDRLALGGTSATGVTVSGGKYIGNHVYLELTGGGRQGPSAQVEIRATSSLSLVSQIGGEVGAKLGIRWRRDYGRAPVGK